MKIEVKNSKIKELPLKANVIHTTKSFNMEINDSIKGYPIDDDDAFFVHYTDGRYIAISYESNDNLELVTLGDNNLGILKLSMDVDEVISLLSKISRGLPGNYIYAKNEHAKLLVDNIISRNSNYDSFYDIVFYDISRELKKAFSQPMLSSKKPTSVEILKYTEDIKIYESFKEFDKSKGNMCLYWFIHETLSTKYIDSINKERELIKNYIEDNVMGALLSKTKIFECYKDFRFEDSKYRIDELINKYDDIESFLEISNG